MTEGSGRLLELDSPPTAIFAANDVSAAGALVAIRETGFRVPEDIAIIGFDDVPLAAHLDVAPAI
ncbi:substrate-binding domain-containing protein [Aminobacter sp. MSH1]|uniref:substrate-binding domain-containing protein n=1 Tax=Aminobacter sp. MSH1 TaxID=374606 RepID=UPI000D3B0440|nr:substrate-binding domain-containing protein [Aminobacter sp. MSH1]